ncbi:unnamed protein product [Diabrotica balteata]|uniref:Uncharacterized protein n=1 Tax=Diabrotica balteata TaxID=107213 RepID=A0A9P0DXA7_DIABA|nr:unnamed protein product [Diabrotica balteata]
MAGVSYTADEDNLILKLIIDTKAYYVLRDKEYWVDLATLGLFDKSRTWMSIQDRFNKNILPNIMNEMYTIPEEDKHRILLAWEQTAENFHDSDGDEDYDTDDTDSD